MTLQELRRILAQFEPSPWEQALLIVVASFVAARLAQFVLTRLAPRLTSRTRTDVDDKLIELLRTPISASALLAGAYLALLSLGVEAPYDYIVFGILKTLAILLWQLFLGRVAKLGLEVLSRHRDRFTLVQPQTLPVLGNIATALVLGVSVYFLFEAWEINVSAWVTSAGILGLAVSLAAKDSLANLFGGLTILADRPYKLGDFIVLESGERGEVTHIGIRSSRILTRDDIEVIVPNSLLINSKITNEAGGPNRHYRVRVKVSAAYGSDVDQVRRVLEEIAHGEPEIQEEPEPRVRFRRFGDSGLEFELLAWVAEPVMRGRVLDKLNTTVYKRFAAEGIQIPYPKRDVYIHKVPDETQDADLP